MATAPRALMGKKIGMTRVFDQDGRNVPVTVIEVGPCFISQLKTDETDGYSAVQVAYEEIKPRNSTMPLIGHDLHAGVPVSRYHREFRVDAADLAELSLGQQLTLEVLDGVKFVDVTGTSKGKGFQGVMRRHGFKGQPATHGTERKHRSPGSIASRATNRGFSGRPKKGVRMAGHQGDVRVTQRSLEVIAADKDKNLLLVKGPVPGANQGLVMVREATRLYKGKARKAAEAS